MKFSANFKLSIVTSLLISLPVLHVYAAEEAVAGLEELVQSSEYKEVSELTTQILGDTTSLEDIFSEEENKGVIFSLEDCIYLSLKAGGTGAATVTIGAVEGSGGTELTQNTTLESAYLSRITQQLSLEDAENAYLPSGTLKFSAGRKDSDTRGRGTHERGYTFTGPSVTLNKKIKTGGDFAFTWANSTTMADNGRTSAVTTDWSLGFTQPLLKGAGFDIANISLTKAYLNEKTNILGLKSTVIKTVNSVVKAYRAYIQAIINFKIQEKAIDRARESFKRTEILVNAGRQSKNTLLDQSVFMAEKEIQWETDQNSKDQARIALLRIMNISTDTQIVPDRLDYYELKEGELPELENALNIAYLYDEEYLTALINMRRAELEFLQVKNNQLWDLSVNAKINNANNGSNVLASSVNNAYKEAYNQDKVAWEVGLSLGIDLPLNNNSKLSSLVNGRIGIRNAKISMGETQQNLISNLKNKLRDIKSFKRQVDLEKIRLEQKQRQIAQEKLKFEAGQTTSFEYTGRQDELIASQKGLLDRKIAYLNALTDFDDALGTTLETWQISLNDRLAKKPEFLKNYYQKQLSKN